MVLFADLVDELIIDFHTRRLYHWQSRHPTYDIICLILHASPIYLLQGGVSIRSHSKLLYDFLLIYFLSIRILGGWVIVSSDQAVVAIVC